MAECRSDETSKGKDHPKADTAPATEKPVEPPKTIEEEIREWLGVHGYPFEMRVAAVFHRAGEFVVDQSSYYFAGDKPQEIDIVAISNSQIADGADSAIVDVRAVVSCKSNQRNQRPWVVFTSPSHIINTTVSSRFGYE